MGKAGGTLLGSEAVAAITSRKEWAKSRGIIIGCSANCYDLGVQQLFLDAGAAACWPVLW